MTTSFKLLCDSCGLSLSEAAAFLNCRRDTVRSWSSGRNAIPERPREQLIELFGKIERAAREAVMVVKDRGGAEEIEIGLSSDDHEAQSLGWPCVGAHAAVIRRIIEITGDKRIVIVPRGSTASSAAAADAHGK